MGKVQGSFTQPIFPPIPHQETHSLLHRRGAFCSLKVFTVLAIAVALFDDSSSASAQQVRKPFTVVDELGLTLFDSPDGGPADVVLSPDGSYFAIQGKRGRPESNYIEDSLYFYRVDQVKKYLAGGDASQPSPVWVISREAQEGGAINGYRWLADSSGIVLNDTVFNEQTKNSNQRLVFADFKTKKIEPLTSETEVVKDFDIRDRRHYVYTVSEKAIVQEKRSTEQDAPAVIGTNRGLLELILRRDPRTPSIAPGAPPRLWAVVDGKRFKVTSGGMPLENFDGFALSPDGRSILSKMPLTDVPQSWETLYPPPPYSISDHRIHAGHYDAKSSRVHQYVRIDLETGAIHPLTNAPLADDSGWLGMGGPSWSSDGKQVLLPNTFVKSKDGKPTRPCIAVLDLASNAITCVENSKAHTTKDNVEAGYHFVWGARFVAGDHDNVQVAFISHEDQSFGTTEYQRKDETWQPVGELKGSFPERRGELEVKQKQGLNEPPMLVVGNENAHKVILDPNPQLKNIELGEATVYKWKDKDGREWKGGLYKPVGYEPGRRYPLVIQTHGFGEDLFRPSGLFPTGMAARALAAQGIMVLQTVSRVAGERYTNCADSTTDEGACGVAMLEGAANQLVTEGLVDPDRIGAVGFSRTCYPVMQSLAFGAVHFHAALVTDGVMFGLFEYTLFPELSGEYNKVIGAEPFTQKGLQEWLKRSPGFNLDKVNTPLMVVGEGPGSLLGMWQPYAALHYLNKPVELVMLNTDEHVLSNPAVRYASQQGSVDWFRFWLLGYEDPDPSKAEQYVRWRGLKRMQQENDAKARAAQN